VDRGEARLDEVLLGPKVRHRAPLSHDLLHFISIRKPFASKLMNQNRRHQNTMNSLLVEKMMCELRSPAQIPCHGKAPLHFPGEQYPATKIVENGVTCLQLRSFQYNSNTS
jgi:hypothetical protein